MSAESRFEPEQILRCLNAHGVRYVVVGGFAVAAHGVVRATADLDVIVERSWENAGLLARALEELAAYDLEGGRDTVSREALVRPADRLLRTRHGDLHVLHELEGVPPYEALQPAVRFEIGDVSVHVASLEALREMKLAAGRDKDRLDLAELDALGRADAPDSAD